MMILELLHKADLSFLLYRLMSRAVFADTECIMCPDELDRELHECCHSYSRLHIVREHEECTARCNHASV